MTTDEDRAGQALLREWRSADRLTASQLGPHSGLVLFIDDFAIF